MHTSPSRLQAANIKRTTCRALNYYTSSARSSSTCRRLRRTFPSAPRSTIARNTRPSRERRARHCATSSTAPGAPLRRFQAPRVRQISSPSGTTGARKLPLAATAAREAQLHVVAGCATARKSAVHSTDRSVHWRTFYNSLWNTLFKSLWKTSAILNKKWSIKINCCSCWLRSIEVM